MTGQKRPTSHLFAIRLWCEEVDEEQQEWRGKLTHILSGEVEYFREWSRLIELLDKRLPELTAESPDAEESL